MDILITKDPGHGFEEDGYYLCVNSECIALDAETVSKLIDDLNFVMDFYEEVK